MKDNDTVFGIEIIGISKHKSGTPFNIEVPWWDADELIKDSRFIRSKETAFPAYEANLPIEEMAILHEKYKPNVTSGEYDQKSKSWLNSHSSSYDKRIKSWLSELEDALYQNSNKYHHFKVNIFAGIIGTMGQLMTYDNGRVLPAEWYDD